MTSTPDHGGTSDNHRLKLSNSVQISLNSSVDPPEDTNNQSEPKYPISPPSLADREQRKDHLEKNGQGDEEKNQSLDGRSGGDSPLEARALVDPKGHNQTPCNKNIANKTEDNRSAGDGVGRKKGSSGDPKDGPQPANFLKKLQKTCERIEDTKSEKKSPEENNSKKIPVGIAVAWQRSGVKTRPNMPSPEPKKEAKGSPAPTPPLPSKKFLPKKEKKDGTNKALTPHSPQQPPPPPPLDLHYGPRYQEAHFGEWQTHLYHQYHQGAVGEYSLLEGSRDLSGASGAYGYPHYFYGYSPEVLGNYEYHLFQHQQQQQAVAHHQELQHRAAQAENLHSPLRPVPTLHIPSSSPGSVLGPGGWEMFGGSSSTLSPKSITSSTPSPVTVSGGDLRKFPSSPSFLRKQSGGKNDFKRLESLIERRDDVALLSPEDSPGKNSSPSSVPDMGKSPASPGEVVRNIRRSKDGDRKDFHAIIMARVKKEEEERNEDLNSSTNTEPTDCDIDINKLKVNSHNKEQEKTLLKSESEVKNLKILPIPSEKVKEEKFPLRGEETNHLNLLATVAQEFGTLPAYLRRKSVEHKIPFSPNGPCTMTSNVANVPVTPVSVPQALSLVGVGVSVSASVPTVSPSAAAPAIDHFEFSEDDDKWTESFRSGKNLRISSSLHSPPSPVVLKIPTVKPKSPLNKEWGKSNGKLNGEGKWGNKRSGGMPRNCDTLNSGSKTQKSKDSFNVKKEEKRECFPSKLLSFSLESDEKKKPPVSILASMKKKEEKNTQHSTDSNSNQNNKSIDQLSYKGNLKAPGPSDQKYSKKELKYSQHVPYSKREADEDFKSKMRRSFQMKEKYLKEVKQLKNLQLLKDPSQLLKEEIKINPEKHEGKQNDSPLIPKMEKDGKDIGNIGKEKGCEDGKDHLKRENKGGLFLPQGFNFGPVPAALTCLKTLNKINEKKAAAAAQVKKEENEWTANPTYAVRAICKPPDFSPSKDHQNVRPLTPVESPLNGEGHRKPVKKPAKISGARRSSASSSKSSMSSKSFSHFAPKKKAQSKVSRRASGETVRRKRADSSRRASGEGRHMRPTLKAEPIMRVTMDQEDDYLSDDFDLLRKEERKEEVREVVLHTVEDLEGEMRILTDIQGLFYTGKLNALQPPDVYGVTLDNERGAPPHIIFSAEEVLEKCIREVKPIELENGLRICAYWSPQYSGLYPGRISLDSAQPNSDLVPIEFDDGDTGFIKTDEIRLLSQNHPIRAYDPNPLLTLEKKHRKRRHSSAAGSQNGWSEGADSELKSDEDDEEDKFPFKVKKGNKVLYWTWNGLGYKRPKTKKNRNKEFFRGIQRGDEVINVGDAALFISNGNERPFIGRVERFWEKKGQKVVNVRWFYHPEEVKSRKKALSLKYSGALFESPHIDENDVQTIARKCEVLPFEEFKGRFGEISVGKNRRKEKDVYYNAGFYDPYTFNLQIKEDLK